MKMNTMNCFVCNLTKIPYPKAAVTAMKVNLILVSEVYPNKHRQELVHSNKHQIAPLETRQQ